MALEPVEFTPTWAERRAHRHARRFWIALALTVPVFVLEMGSHLFGCSHLIPGAVSNWVQLILATPVVLWAGAPFFARGYRSVLTRNLNMFTLIALGTGAAYAYSVVATLLPEHFPPLRGPRRLGAGVLRGRRRHHRAGAARPGAGTEGTRAAPAAPSVPCSTSLRICCRCGLILSHATIVRFWEPSLASCFPLLYMIVVAIGSPKSVGVLTVVENQVRPTTPAPIIMIMTANAAISRFIRLRRFAFFRSSGPPLPPPDPPRPPPGPRPPGPFGPPPEPPEGDGRWPGPPRLRPVLRAAPTRADPTAARPDALADASGVALEEGIVARPTVARPAAAAEPTEADPTEAEPTEAEPTEADPTEAHPTEADPTEADPTEARPPADAERGEGT